MASFNLISYTYIRYLSVTDQILEKCSTLFNNNYGIWSEDAPLHSNYALQAGARVRLGVKRLRELLLFNDRCFLIIAEIRSSDHDQPELIGHAFCTFAKYDRLNGNVIWITQLVVSSSYRGQGVAGTLISMGKNSVEDVVAAGLVSSHPYAIIALSNACNRISIDLKFIGDHAKDVIRVCNIPYLSEHQLVGSIFNIQSLLVVENNQQQISLVKTDFFVDHKEVLAILKDIRQKWILGPLLDGHEFLAILPTTSVRHSRTPLDESSTNTLP
jgi:predicted GNAT family acetyltransferase